MVEQMVRELRDREDVDQVEEQLDRPDFAPTLAPLPEQTDVCVTRSDRVILRSGDATFPPVVDGSARYCS